MQGDAVVELHVSLGEIEFFDCVGIKLSEGRRRTTVWYGVDDGLDEHLPLASLRGSLGYRGQLHLLAVKVIKSQLTAFSDLLVLYYGFNCLLLVLLGLTSIKL